MKTLILAVLLIVSANSYSQKTEWLFGISKDSCKILADDVMNKVDGNFVFVKQDSYVSDAANFFEVMYKSEKLKQQHSVVFQQFENRYYFNGLEGKFSDLFSIWQQYIDVNASSESIIKNLGTTKNIDNPTSSKKYIRCVLQPSDLMEDEWYIKFQHL